MEIASLGGKAKASKYRNIPTVYDGIRFDSRKEADYYRDLCMLKAAGEIRGMARQVKLPLPSGKRSMRIDFMVVGHDGSIRWVDVKGPYRHDAWRTKRDELQHALGIEIELV